MGSYSSKKIVTYAIIVTHSIFRVSYQLTWPLVILSL